MTAPPFTSFRIASASARFNTNQPSSEAGLRPYGVSSSFASSIVPPRRLRVFEPGHGGQLGKRLLRDDAAHRAGAGAHDDGVRLGAAGRIGDSTQQRPV